MASKLCSKYFDICLSDGYSSSEEEGAVPRLKKRMEIRKNDETFIQSSSESISDAISALFMLSVDEEPDESKCQICEEVFGKSEIITLPCSHCFCKTCTKGYFNVKITECAIVNWVCPECKEPKMIDVDSDDSDYFTNLELIFRSLLDPNIYELYQKKLLDRNLSKEPNFQWCVNCTSGFIKRPKQKRLICPDCGLITCSMCSLKWEDQHEGISCEKFSEWKSENDSVSQEREVQKHLETNGIDCPKCKFRYSLARGGCLHMDCTQCGHAFCFGCRKPILYGQSCKITQECYKMGLHGHHPRNCLYYMRDKEVHELQTLLTIHNIPLQPSHVKTSAVFCPVLVQDETPDGFVDKVCNDRAESGYGLCGNHYKEHLVDVIWKNKIDSLPIMDLNDCFQEIRRHGVPLPYRGPYDTDEIYVGMCRETIKQSILLG